MSDGKPKEQVFTLEATPMKFGPGAARETGWELKRLGVERAMVVTDRNVVEAGVTGQVVESLDEEGIQHEVFDQAYAEPTAESLQQAADFALEGKFDGFVGVGGGKKPPSPLRPLVAVPTTAGTGSEATSVAVLDIPEEKVKSGISHSYLRPRQAIVDPELSKSMPRSVASSAGLDVVCHAAESFVARPFDTRDAPDSPDDRPPYQGSNPISDLWSARALEYGGRYLRRAVKDADDVEARGHMMLAASLAGIGFGSAGVHIPHACSYPIASLKHEWTPPGYPTDHPYVPHGWSVIVTSPASFRYTFPADPERHRRAAELLKGEPVEEVDESTLPEVLLELMRDVGAPSGIRELGYEEEDVDALVEGALKQQRLLVVSPREAGPHELAGILRESFENW